MTSGERWACPHDAVRSAQVLNAKSNHERRQKNVGFFGANRSSEYSVTHTDPKKIQPIREHSAD
jgi:hypothetical protein